MSKIIMCDVCGSSPIGGEDFSVERGGNLIELCKVCFFTLPGANDMLNVDKLPKCIECENPIHPSAISDSMLCGITKCVADEEEPDYCPGCEAGECVGHTYDQYCCFGEEQ